MTLYVNRAERSALHAAMLAALNLPLEYSEEDAVYRRQAWVEAVAWCGPAVFALAEKMETVLPEDYTEIPSHSLDSLRAREGAMEVAIALRLCGYRCRPHGNIQSIWTNAPMGSGGQTVTLPEVL